MAIDGFQETIDSAVADGLFQSIVGAESLAVFLEDDPDSRALVVMAFQPSPKLRPAGKGLPFNIVVHVSPR